MSKKLVTDERNPRRTIFYDQLLHQFDIPDGVRLLPGFGVNRKWLDSNQKKQMDVSKDNSQTDGWYQRDENALPTRIQQGTGFLDDVR